mmetsp:Transcript_2794/g.5148  ORF Transcript_2794/g.5148 Transcript_2794/m.5148 type:complete len:127 (+) Transcript_2794:1049-1429(+)
MHMKCVFTCAHLHTRVCVHMCHACVCTGIKDPSRTRKSQATHYFFEGDFFHIAPVISRYTGDPTTSQFYVKESIPKFAKADEMRDAWVNNLVTGEPVFHNNLGANAGRLFDATCKVIPDATNVKRS